MKRLVLPLAALLLAFTGQTARAQLGVRPTTPLSNPAISPYLNLLRPGTNPAVNYYGLVRPQLQTQNELQALQTQQQALAAQPYLDNAILTQPIANTGTGAGFLNYNRYFLTNNGRGGSGGGGSSFTQPQINIGTPHR